MVFVPETGNQSVVLNSIFPFVRHYPPIRHDLAEIDRMVNKLAALTASDRGRVYVLASSLVLSDDVLRNAAYQGHEQLQQKILLSSHVDKRDGFPSYLLSADYIVTAFPLQRHLRAEDQQVVALPLMDIEQHRGIGRSFERIEGPFSLEGGVKANIYKRIAPMRKSDMDALEKIFVSRYPAHREEFKINHLCGLIETRETDLSPATMDCQNESLHFTTRENRRTNATFRLGRDYRTFSALFKFGNISDTKGGCGEVGLRIFADGKQIFSDRMVYLNPRNLSFNVANVDVLTISVDRGNNGLACDWFTVDYPVIE
jgi:hypothetical protein